VVSVGVKVVESVWVPALSTVPDAGEYAKLPGVFAVASSCVELNGVPKVIAAGAGQAMTGVALLTACVMGLDVTDLYF
jgi:hypothetical protein